MKPMIFILITGCLYSTAHAQTAADTAVTHVRQLLTPGNHLVHEYTESPPQPSTPEQHALLARVLNALPENEIWVLDPDSVAPVAGMKEKILADVRKKLHLSEDEWKTLQQMAGVAKKDVARNGQDTLEITVRGNILYFRGTGKAAVLNAVSFDLTHNTALFRQRRLTFVNIFHLPAASSGFQTPFVTYAYEWSNTGTINSNAALPLETYDFGVSYQPLTGKTMLLLMTATGNTQGADQVSQVQNLTFVID